MIQKKQISILGSTGSIGTNTLEVIRQHSHLFEVHSIAAGSNVDLLIEQAKIFNPKVIVIFDENKISYLRKFINKQTKILSGMEGLLEMVSYKENIFQTN